jgi:hypothetical protein
LTLELRCGIVSALEVSMDSDRLQYVAQRHAQLQGLRLLPLSVLFLIKGAYDAGWFPLPGDDRPHVAGRWFFAALFVAIAASYAIRAWYVRRFDALTQRVRDSQFWPLAVGFVCFVLAGEIQSRARLPFSLPSVTVGLLLASVGIPHYRFRRHYLAAAAVCIAVAFVPLLGIPARLLRVLFDVAAATVLAIVGVGDHRLLATTPSTVAADIAMPLYEVEADV